MSLPLALERSSVSAISSGSVTCARTATAARINSRANPDSVNNLRTLNSLIVCQVVPLRHYVNALEALSVYPDAGAQRSSPLSEQKNKGGQFICPPSVLL